MRSTFAALVAELCERSRGLTHMWCCFDKRTGLATRSSIRSMSITTISRRVGDVLMQDYRSLRSGRFAANDRLSRCRQDGITGHSSEFGFRRVGASGRGLSIRTLGPTRMVQPLTRRQFDRAADHLSFGPDRASDSATLRNHFA